MRARASVSAGGARPGWRSPSPAADGVRRRRSAGVAMGSRSMTFRSDWRRSRASRRAKHQLGRCGALQAPL